ncbi:MAG: glutamate--tRNA ligase [Bacteroidota bacterium]
MIDTPQKVRVRFAPSPTGPLHIGGIRTALYNYLFAKKWGGEFLLRIEDTDQNRFVPSSEKYIKESLTWLGLIPDEGPEKGGNYGPYRQSERKTIYVCYIKKLLESGQVYYAFDTPEELNSMRERQKKLGVAAPAYNAITRMQMSNSLTLPPQQTAEKLKAGEPYVVRMKINPKEKVKFKDVVRGWIEVQGNTLDDKVLFKSDGMPTYHLANIVDDHLMKITHVIRGEEWLPSTPIHVLLYQAFGWNPPMFAHLPLLLRSDGQGKLSKRFAEKNDTIIFPLNWKDPITSLVAPGFREAGYLPQAVINFLSLLGWHADNNKEVYQRDELIKAFSLERLKKAGVRLDIIKARWFNQEHLKSIPSNILAQRYLLPVLQEKNIEASLAYSAQVCDLLKERVTFPESFWEEGSYFFQEPSLLHNTLWKSKTDLNALTFLQSLAKQLTSIANWSSEVIQSLLKNQLKRSEITPKQVMPLLRLVLTGRNKGPHLADIMYVLGLRTTLKRLQLVL